ncbi:chemotaxis protein CheA [Azospirillum sp.]|uniref:chemotaxis protein CheA n=1 Tax=Azospirillum sp. TaxID=34012 RepID=UPI002D5AEBAF|nr:chemotaxis protein CheA [Azospirillum sp.]HYD68927.1 chemotaxis protein CheA [Azospirillum sp.]
MNAHAHPDPADTFRQEAQDLLEQLEQALLDLEQTPDDRALIDSAFRALHTIKGSGAMFGFEAVAAFTHHFETAFDRVRRGEVPPTGALIAVALASKDHIRSLIDSPAEADGVRGAAILSDLQAITDAPAAVPEAPAVAAPPDGVPATWRIRFRLAKDAMALGTNPLLLLDELRDLGPCTATALTDGVPALEEMEPDACYLGWEVTLTTARPRAAIEEVFLFVIDDMELAIERVDGAPASPVAAAPATPEPREEEPATREPAREAARGAAVIRVQAERLDELMDRVGELVIAQARLTQLAAGSGDANIKAIAEEVERLASELRDTSMGIRMVPIGSLFGRFRRLVHDLSRDLGKAVELVTGGEETELDKTVVERLADPVVHLIRNAVDHGLETPEGRAAAGKPPAGRVRLTARHAGAEVQIIIADDGRGLDRERIRARAEEQGLLAPGAKLADADLFQFLFHPGFSTAREITAVSGRGVGMDVVKRTIESLRGAIDVTTTAGQGTEVTLRLPLTLAIIDGLMVRVGDGRYVIPLSAVEECVELSAADDARSKGRSFLNIRGELVPFLRLRELFNAATPPALYQKVVIVSSGDMRVGLVVDQIIGSHQTVIKSLSKLHADVETFSGATILGDGTVALILDVLHLVEFGQAREERLKAPCQMASCQMAS